METKLEKEVRCLRIYAVVATLFCAIFLLSGFVMQSKKQKFPREGGRPAGMIFLNERGDEVGGLIFSGDTGKERYGSLTFDKFRGDQTIAFQHLESNEGNYSARLSFNDENMATTDRIAKVDAIKKLPDEAARKAAFKDMQDKGEFLVNRLSLGRGRNKSAFISLSDSRGRERIQISVTADGTPAINFLDEKGGVTYRLPENKQD